MELLHEATSFSVFSNEYNYNVGITAKFMQLI